MLLTLLQGLIFVSYITFLWVKFKGPLPSISESWYRLKELGGLWYWLFTLFCLALGITMIFQSYEPNITTSWFFISGSALCFVGAATAFKDYSFITPYVHSISAGICIICALAGIGVEYHSWIPAIIFTVLTALIKLLKINNGTWWIEISAFVSILSGLLIF